MVAHKNTESELFEYLRGGNADFRLMVVDEGVYEQENLVTGFVDHASFPVP